MQGIDEGIDESDGIVLGNGVIEPLEEQALFVAMRAVDKAHAGTKR